MDPKQILTEERDPIYNNVSFNKLIHSRGHRLRGDLPLGSIGLFVASFMFKS